MAIKIPESPEIPENEPFNLFCGYDRIQQRETWYDKAYQIRFTMPMIELVDEYPVGDLFHVNNPDMLVKWRRTVP